MTTPDAREQFLVLVGDIRPDLHRYCARLTGSVIDGEDIVQDTLAKAFWVLAEEPRLPELRPWLFRIAHNRAIDFLRSHGRRFTDVRDDLDEDVGEEPLDPATVRAAIGRFLALPVGQRSAVILKDVLDCSLEDTAAVMGTTVLAVKAALFRGRAGLRAAPVSDDAPAPALDRASLERYASLFNAKDWDGLRALVADDCRLDLVTKSRRRGKEVGMYFGRYAKEDVALRVTVVDGRLALAAHVAGAADPAYFILLEWTDGRVASIRDYRYVPYIQADVRSS